MNEKEIKEKLESVEVFKNVQVNFNEETELCDIYLKCRIPIEDFTSKINNIEADINVNPCDFGIVEILFCLKDKDSIIEKIMKEFK